MATKRSKASLAIDPSSDDDISAFRVVHRSTTSKTAVAPTPTDQEGDGDEIYSSDEIGENGAVIQRQPPPRRMAVVKIPEKNAGAARSPPRKKKEAGKAAAAPASPPLLTTNDAAAHVTRSPSLEKAADAQASDAARSPPRKRAAASEAAKSPPPKKAAPAGEEAATALASKASPPTKKARTARAGTPPPTVPADTAPNAAPLPEAAAPSEENETLTQLQEGNEFDAEKHFKEKSQAYKYLWHMVLTLEEECLLPFKGAFLKIDDTKADILNTEIKKLYVQEMKNLLCWKNTEQQVTKMLIDLIQ